MTNANDNVAHMGDFRKDDKSKKKTIAYITLGSILIGVIFYLSYYWFVYSDTHIATDNSYVENDLFPVNSRMMGFVKESSFKENELVKKGDILAVFDDKDLRLELSYKVAKLTKAKADFERAEKLIKTNTISKMEYEAAKANLEAQNTDHEATLLKIEFTKILAPVDGVIAKKTVQVGQFIQPGQSLFVIVPNTGSWVRANYKETQIGKIRIGMKVELIADAMPDQKFYGMVESISPSSGSRLSLLPPENATGNFTKVVQRFPVIIRVTDKAGQLLKAGMSVNSTVLTTQSFARRTAASVTKDK